MTKHIMKLRDVAKRSLGQSRFTEKMFRPYVIAIGELALAWNDLHEKLASLFWTILGGGWKERPIGIWNSSNFDRPRREMLKAAVVASTNSERMTFPNMVADICWVLAESEKLEQARNNAIHSPLLMARQSSIFLEEVIRGAGYDVIPNDLLKNPRALKLAKKDLLTEFRWCRDASLVLRDFSIAVDRALCETGVPWPKRPSLPNRGQKNGRRNPPHLLPAKRYLPPRSPFRK
jgi:hypothetical protein